MSFRRAGVCLGVPLALLLGASDGYGQTLFSGARGAQVPAVRSTQGAQVPGARGAQGATVPGTPSVVVRARTAAIDMPLLASAGIEALTAAPSTSLVLNLFDDVVLVAVGERVETDAWGHRSWVGRVDGVANSTATLTWIGDTVVATVHAGAAVYRIEASQGLATISEIDPAQAGTESEPLQPPGGPRELPSNAPHADQPRPGTRSSGIASHEPGVVDVFMYYTPAAEARQGGRASIEALVAKGIADTNTAFIRSRVHGSVRLVGTMRATGYVEDPFNLETDLRNLTFSPQATAARDATGADVVALLVANAASGACGIAWLGPSPDFGFSVSATECLADGQWTFTHEVAHNFGSHHNKENAFGTPFRSYSYGHYDTAAGFRTVMSYPGPCGGCPRILNYSNPATSFSGKPTGTTDANNARSLSEAFSLVASFRDVPAGPPGPPQDVHVTVSGLTAEIFWTPPDTGGPVTTYIGQAGTTPGASDVYNGPVGASNRIIVATRPGVYYARVLAQNARGTSAPSNEVAATVGITCETPTAPATIGTVEGRLARVMWMASPDTSVSGYTVLVGSRPGASDVYRLPVGLATEISGTLQPGTYYVRVAAHTSCGAATASSDTELRVF